MSAAGNGKTRWQIRAGYTTTTYNMETEPFYLSPNEESRKKSKFGVMSYIYSNEIHFDNENVARVKYLLST